jgi:hypothetical protein
MEGRKLSILCYIEGYLIPLKSISIASQVGIPTIVTMTTLPSGMREEITPTSRVMIFYAYLSNNDGDPWDEYKLLFHGETTGTGVSQSGTTTEMQISAIDTRSYLNRLPDRMWGALYETSSDIYYNFYQDADFYGIPKDSVVKGWINRNIGFFAEQSNYTLREYTDRILGLLRIEEFPYCYYHNADIRYRIIDSHYVLDTVIDSSNPNSQEVFEAIWGSLYKNSMIQNMNNLLMTGQATAMDNLARSLVGIGYNYTHTLSPKYRAQVDDSTRDGLYEYLIARDMVNHRAPKCNYILVDRDDAVNISINAPEVTSTKYKYKTNLSGQGNEIAIENTVYPPESMRGNDLVMTDDEKLYGISREVVDMNYFYSSFLRSQAGSEGFYRGGENGKGDILYAKQAYEFIQRRTGRNSATVRKGSFIPEYVLGMPAVVHDPLTGRMCRGNIWRLSYAISMESGSSMTSIDMVNVQLMSGAEDADEEAKGGANPIGKDSFLEQEKRMHRILFYDKNKTEPLLGSSDINDNKTHREYYDFIGRNHCTMREYFKMILNGEDAEFPADIVEDVAELAPDTTFCTLEENHGKAYGYSGFKLRQAFIEDRRQVARQLYMKLKERIQHAEGQ